MEIWQKHLKEGLIKKSTSKGKKLMTEYDGKIIHFGSSSYEHFKDKTGIWSNKDHKDEKRKQAYQNRHSKIMKDNKKAYENPNSPSYWSWNILW